MHPHYGMRQKSGGNQTNFKRGRAQWGFKMFFVFFSGWGGGVVKYDEEIETRRGKKLYTLLSKLFGTIWLNCQK